jgi:hypothetical protein
MKNLLLFLLSGYMGMAASGLCAQKHDYIWLTGYSSTPNSTLFGGTVIDFNENPPDLYYEFRDMSFFQANASICDTAGNLLFYTNGIYIANALGEPMENGTGLNPGPHAEQWQNYGYIVEQGAIALPLPENEHQYIVLHEDNNEPIGLYTFHARHLYCSFIDMEDGLGKVMEKNRVVLDDFLDMGKLTATKHANGRDWWVLTRQYGTNKYYKVLVRPDSVLVEGTQQIGIPVSSQSIGQAVFSPNGQKYANVHLTGVAGDPIYVSIYDFDRCSGELSYPVQFTYADTAWCGGVAISPNSRFLYVSSFRYVYQYDLEAADIEASRVTVAEWDGFHDTLYSTPGRATTFYLAQLAPDGKIYINSNNSVAYMHVINEPDSLGLACSICQHCMELPTKNSFSMPNFPNYRLAHLEGSPCDTLRQPPVAAWRYEPGGLSVAFEDESYHDIRTWRWDFGDGATDSLPAPVHEYAAAGAYEVCLAVSNPRGSDTLCQVVEIVPSSSREAVAGRRLRSAPNPARDQVSIALEPPLPQGARWSLRDLQGRPLRSGTLPPASPC